MSDVQQTKKRKFTSESGEGDSPTPHYPTPPLTPSMSNVQPAKKRKVVSKSGRDFVPPTPPRRLLIKKHSEKARVPTRGSALAAGYDIYRLDTDALDYAMDSELTHNSVQRRNSSQLGGKPLLIPKSPSRSLMTHMDASLREVALVSFT